MVKSSALSLSVYLQQLYPLPTPYHFSRQVEISLPGKHNEPVVKLAILQSAELKKKKKIEHR